MKRYQQRHKARRLRNRARYDTGFVRFEYRDGMPYKSIWEAQGGRFKGTSWLAAVTRDSIDRLIELDRINMNLDDRCFVFNT